MDETRHTVGAAFSGLSLFCSLLRGQGSRLAGPGYARSFDPAGRAIRSELRAGRQRDVANRALAVCVVTC